MPTPIVSDAKGGAKDISKSDFSPQLREISQLLPTPLASEAEKSSLTFGRGNPTLGGAVRLLKTPTAQLAVNGGSQHPEKRKEGGHGPTLADEIEHLLPTPTTRNGQGNATNSRGEMLLPGVARDVALMPTPQVADVTGGHRTRSGRRSGELLLPGLAEALAERSSGVSSAPLFDDGEEF